jgi:hypothetical protein
MEKHGLGRKLLAGLAGGATLNLAMVLTFRLLGFGWQGGGILLDPSLQSPKLIAVWTSLKPLPLVIANPAPIVLGLLLFGLGHALVYAWLAPHWPGGILARGWRMALLLFFFSFCFWEFFTPFNQLGEPVALIGLELLFWALIAGAEGLALAAVFESGGGRGDSQN